MIIIDPYCFLYKTGDNIDLKLYQLLKFIEFLEDRKLFNKSIFLFEIFNELMSTYPYNDESFNRNYYQIYNRLSEVIRKCSNSDISEIRDTGNFTFDDNLYSEFNEQNKNKILNIFYNNSLIDSHLLILKGEDLPLFLRNNSQVRIINSEQELAKIPRLSYEHNVNFLPYFKPSDKHKSYATTGITGSILTQEDEEDCYHLIDEAIKIKDTSDALIAFNKRTGHIIKFPITQGNEFHAFPIEKEYYRTHILPHLDYDILNH